VYYALRTGNPYIVLRALADYIKVVGFYNTRLLIILMPSATFSKVLRCLDLKHFIS
jgi:hypothetical protein